MPFLKALARSEMQTASSTILNRVTDFIFYNGNRYPKRAYMTVSDLRNEVVNPFHFENLLPSTVMTLLKLNKTN